MAIFVLLIQKLNLFYSKMAEEIELEQLAHDKHEENGEHNDGLFEFCTIKNSFN